MSVQGKDTVVGVAHFFEYDAISEAVEGLGEEKCLELINAQVRANEMNRVRGAVRSGPSKKALESKVLASITEEEWQRVAGKRDAIRALLNERFAQFKAEAEGR